MSLADIEELADVRVIERRDGVGFAFETRAAVRIARKFFAQDLDGDDAIEPGVAGFVDLTHAPGANQGEDFVCAESGAGREGHAVVAVAGL